MIDVLLQSPSSGHSDDEYTEELTKTRVKKSVKRKIISSSSDTDFDSESYSDGIQEKVTHFSLNYQLCLEEKKMEHVQ